ncbi:LOW QUALITY PROTEIN: zinc finger C2HC domain-containing protein 1A [Sylvia borin]
MRVALVFMSREGRGVSLSGDTPNPPGRVPVSPALGDPALAGHNSNVWASGPARSHESEHAWLLQGDAQPRCPAPLGRPSQGRSLSGGDRAGARRGGAGLAIPARGGRRGAALRGAEGGRAAVPGPEAALAPARPGPWRPRGQWERPLLAGREVAALPQQRRRKPSPARAGGRGAPWRGWKVSGSGGTGAAGGRPGRGGSFVLRLGRWRRRWERGPGTAFPVGGAPAAGSEVAVQTGDLLPCKICGRTFFPAALKKHGPICQKTSAKKRKTFDSSRQRAEGTDIPTVKPLKPRPEPPKKPSNWRRKHEEFIATIRAAKGLNLKDGGKLPPPPPPSYDPDYIQCPYCQRRFNENAADRHINFCKEQAARITNKGKLAADTKGKLPTRTQYKPAPVKKMPSVGSTPSPSSRLPQPSGVSKTGVGMKCTSSSKAPSSSGSSGSKIQTLSPAHKNSLGMVNPQAGIEMEELHPLLQTGRDVQRFYDTDTKTDSAIKRPKELLPVKKGTTKTRTSTPPSVSRAMSTGALTNRRKTSNSDTHLRSDGKTGYDTGDCASSVNGGSAKSSEGISPVQLSKFCHECGTKYPVEWAKFCCECGIRRMVV